MESESVRDCHLLRVSLPRSFLPSDLILLCSGRWFLRMEPRKGGVAEKGPPTPVPYRCPWELWLAAREFRPQKGISSLRLNQ